ncbi:hypothetical protein F4818DRAFT_185488 [Hypoxylon cercidicola]|nr:hypothetical protein F4818DRAFT_185488 [Hypoxylon cercidicola]
MVSAPFPINPPCSSLLLQLSAVSCIHRISDARCNSLVLILILISHALLLYNTRLPLCVVRVHLQDFSLEHQAIPNENLRRRQPPTNVRFDAHLVSREPLLPCLPFDYFLSCVSARGTGIATPIFPTRTLVTRLHRIALRSLFYFCPLAFRRTDSVGRANVYICSC